MNVRLDDAARDELIEAAVWYAGRDPAAARRFVMAVGAAFERIGESPDSLPVLETWSGLEPIRRFCLRSFPYVIAFEVLPDEVVIWAVAHAIRKSDYWHGRRQN